jgi:dihydrofolate reductase
MSRIVVINHLTLDGVMQAPAAVDEDTRDGFENGGWAAANQDEVMGEYLGRGMGGGPGRMLFGRRTYEHFYAYWPTQTDGNPYTDVLNRAHKYVASRTLSEPLPWENSTLLAGDAADAIAALREDDGKDIAVLGSGELVQSLRARGLVDEYVLLIHPLLLGTGRRLFPDGGASSKLQLVESLTTSKGVVIARYRPAP